MSKTKISPSDWVVVCDGRKWLILENKGDAELVNLVVRERKEDENPATHEQGTERPGRSHQSVGNSRSAVGQTDWHDQGEADFLKALADKLDTAAQAGEIPGIVLVASPRAMGMIRPHLSGAVSGLIHSEIDKDYVMLPIDQIEKHLGA